MNSEPVDKYLDRLDAEELADNPAAVEWLAEYHERQFWQIIGQESEIPA